MAFLRRGRTMLLLSLLAVLTGCGHHAIAATTPSPLLTSVPTTTTPRTPASPAPPAAGPLATVYGWVRALTTASHTDTLSPLDRWATPTCPCLAGVATSLTALAADGVHLTVDYQIGAATITAQTATAAAVSVELYWAAYQALTASGTPEHAEPAGTSTHLYSLIKDDDQWRITVIS